MRKTVLLTALILFAAGGVYAQNADDSSAPKNTVYGGFGFGAGFPAAVDAEIFASYEREIIPQITVGASVAYQMYPMAIIFVVIDSIDSQVNEKDRTINSVYGYIIEGQFHWYPAGKTFHVDVGLGYSNYLTSMHTILFAPGIGWRIDFGQPGGFIMNIGLRVEYFYPISESFLTEKDTGKSLYPVNIMTFRLGFGYRF